MGTRTPDLYPVNLARTGSTTTYKTAGTAKVRGSHTRYHFLWVGMWAGIGVAICLKAKQIGFWRNTIDPHYISCYIGKIGICVKLAKLLK